MVYGLAFVGGLVSAFEIPIRQSWQVELVGKADLMNAIALNSSAFNLSRVFGPAVAGTLIATAGSAVCFLLNAASFLAVLIGLICSTRTSAEDRCGGVLMTTMTTVMKDRKEMVQKLGFYAIDGGLVMDGKSTCTSIRIECSKEARTCRTASALRSRRSSPSARSSTPWRCASVSAESSIAT